MYLQLMHDAMGIKAIKRHTAQYDLSNRLHSIASDQVFVTEVAKEWFNGRFELVANQRCGTWYCDPSSSKDTYAYFKSTDGHTHNWDFSLRRSNLGLARHAEEVGGLILVDSTRKGKRMPDALSKTIPIWCAVINEAVYQRRLASGEALSEWDRTLYVPGGVVSPSEEAQIKARIPAWANGLLASGLSLPELSRPLRPFFIHHGTSTAPHIRPDPPYTPIICLSASRWVGVTGATSNYSGMDDVPAVTGARGRVLGFEYVPGAGDDDELWARGLTPGLFHAHRERILGASKESLVSVVNDIAAASQSISTAKDGHLEGDKADSKGPVETLVGLRHPGSPIALALGPSESPVPPWKHNGPSTTLWLVEVTKPAAYSETVYAAREADLVVALPSAKLDSKAYSLCLRIVLDTVKGLVPAQNVILRPGTFEQLTEAKRIHCGEIDTIKEGIFDALPVSLSSQMVSLRKTILPIALLLICGLPDFTSLPADGESEKGMSKESIQKALLWLIGLWPDGNPPRAALKRVNECLLNEYGGAK